MRRAVQSSRDFIAGQCAWVDRPLNSAEPTAMLWDLDATVGVRFKAYGSSTPVVAITGGFDKPRAKVFVDYVRTSGSYINRWHGARSGCSVPPFSGGRAGDRSTFA